MQALLPPEWSLDHEALPREDAPVDAILTIRAPDGGRLTFLVGVRRLLATREVADAMWSLGSSIPVIGRTPAQPLLVARYLSPATRARITEMGGSYADATGNVHIAAPQPALYLRDAGAERDPWRGPGRPKSSFQGGPAARVVRALVDFAPPVTMPELARRARTSTGATYRVVQLALEEELLEREERGPIVAVHWRNLLTRWSEDYGFQRTNPTLTYLEPRGIAALVDRLRTLSPDIRYVVTGSLAAERWAPYAPPRAAMLYVDDLSVVEEHLALRPVDGAGNVLVATARHDVVFERAIDVDGVCMAAPSQVAVDLLTGPGRNPSEAMELLGWMEANEDAWRHV